MLKKTCIWTNQKSERAKEITIKTINRFGGGLYEKKVYVLPEHEQEFRQFNEYAIKYSKLFLLMILGLLLIPLMLTVFLFLELITGSLLLVAIGAVTFCIGIGIIFFPFSTPETVSMFGLKQAIRITRILGVITAILGVGTAILPIWI